MFPEPAGGPRDGRELRSQLEAPGTAESCARGPGARGRTRRTCVCLRVGARGHAAPRVRAAAASAVGLAAAPRGHLPSCRPAGEREAAAETERWGGSEDAERTPPTSSPACPNTGPRPSQGASQPYPANAATLGAGADPRGTGGPPEATWGLLKSSR